MKKTLLTLVLLLALVMGSLSSCVVKKGNGGKDNDGTNGSTDSGEGEGTDEGGEGNEGGVGGSEITGDDEPIIDDNGWTAPGQ